MEREDLAELHYIAHIGNLASICEHGILSHTRAERHEPISLADPGPQAERATKRVPGGRRVHDCVNLYFNARNPMLFKRQDYFDDACVLRVSTDVLDLPDTVVTAENVAAGYVRFRSVEEGLAAVNEDLTFAKYWTHADPLQEDRHKKAMCAEVLVPDRVEPEHILGAYVANDTALAKFQVAAPHLDVEIERYVFFNRG